MKEQSFLVVFTRDFPADAFEGDLIGFPLDPQARSRPAMRCKSFAQVPGQLVELVPASESPLRGQALGRVYVQVHHVLFVLQFQEPPVPAGFVSTAR